MTDAEKKMREMLKGLKPEPGMHDIPQELNQPPTMPHPDLHPSGMVKGEE
jgi:hypothetical protein